MAQNNAGNQFQSAFGSREREKAQRRKRFIKRMEAKLRFKESMYDDGRSGRHSGAHFH